MFKLTTTSPQKEVKTVKVKKLPQGLGTYWDGNGGKWHVRGYGKNEDGWWAWMTPIGSVHPHFTDTSTTDYSSYSQTWPMYYLELEDETE